MVTKWKRWTAMTAVKIVSFILILALSFIILNRAYACITRSGDTGIPAEIVLADIPAGQYFYSQKMQRVYYNAIQVLRYKSEASIESGEHIRWKIGPVEYWDGKTTYSDYELIDTNYGNVLAVIDGFYDSQETRAELEQIAIQYQLRDFRAALDYLNNVEGLLYYISDNTDADVTAPDGSRDSAVVISNIDADNPLTADYFRSHPVYYIMDTDIRFESSHNSDIGFPYSYNYYYPDFAETGATLYLAFTAGAVSDQNNIYSEAREGYIYDLSIIAVSAVLVIVLLVILFLGAGRRYSDAENSVHFTLIDRPFLDFSLVVVVGWIVLVILLSVGLLRTVSYYNNAAAMNVLLAALSIAIVAPPLLWLLSFAKRVKAGQFWKHSLIYFIPSRFIRFCVSFFKSLWAGFRLTTKVVLITLASFLSLLITGLAGIVSYNAGGTMAFLSALFFTALTSYLLLRYARRVSILEQGARDASGGVYGAPIYVRGGELGSIANSINNISAGINTAVEQRMKSERLKTELITNVSHDIRTPLTSIITYTDLLKHEGLDNEKAPEYLDILMQKSQRLKTLTDELFEAAKAATGNIEVHITELDIVSLINQVLGELDGDLFKATVYLAACGPAQLV